MADRFMYLPSIGLSVIVAFGAADLVRPWRHSRRVLPVLAGASLSVLVVCTWQQVRRWRDDITVFTHALNVTVNNITAHDGIAKALELD